MLRVAQAATELYHLQLRHHADGVVEPTTPSWRTTLSVRGCSNPMGQLFPLHPSKRREETISGAQAVEAKPVLGAPPVKTQLFKTLCEKRQRHGAAS